jgi:actin-related protein 5
MSSRKSKSRMQAIANLASEDLTKDGRQRKRKADEDDDNFGENDADWAIYQEIKGGAESDGEGDELELEKLEGKLIEFDPDFVRDEDIVLEQRKNCVFHRLHFGPNGYVDPSNREAMNQLYLNTELVRVPEAMFQPYIIGVDQAGVIETIATILSLFNAAEQHLLCDKVLICGGSSLYRGCKDRFNKELRRIRPVGTFETVSIAESSNDAWAGAAKWAFDQRKGKALPSKFVLKSQYEKTAMATRDALFDAGYIV